MEISKLVASFKLAKHARTEAETERFYDSHLKHVLDYFERIKLADLDDITTEIVDAYLGEMKDNGLKQKTLNNRLGIIKQLIKLKKRPEDYTHEQKLIMEDIKAKKPEPEHYKALSREEFIQFLSYVSNLSETKPQALKRKITMILSIGSGARNSEIRNIKLDDIDYDHKRIMLRHTKTHVTRHILMDDNTAKLIKKHITLSKPNTYLIQNELSKGTISRCMLQKYFLEASKVLGFQVSTHILRATFITMMIEDGASLGYVMQLAGHKHLSTTEIYLHMVDKNIADEYEIHNPLAQMDRDSWKSAESVDSLLDSILVDADNFDARA